MPLLAGGLGAVLMVVLWNGILYRSQVDVFNLGAVTLSLLLAVILTAVLAVLLGIFRKDKAKMLPVLLLLAATVFCSLAFLSGFAHPRDIYDTWDLYGYSLNTFRDFGYGNYIRQHILPIHYEMAFPPLMMVLMYAVNAVLDLSVMAGVYIVYLFSLFTVVELVRIMKENGKNETLTAAAALLVMASSSYLEQVRTGNTVLIGIYFLIRLCRVMYSSADVEKKYRQGILLVGLGLMTRFDYLSVFLLFMVLFPVVYWIRAAGKTPKRKLLCIVSNSCAGILIISPWILYSLRHFGTLFVTDNARRVLNIVDTGPSAYFPQSAPALTLFDDFPAWLAAFWGRCMVSLKSGLGYVTKCSLLFLLLAVLLAEGISWWKRTPKKSQLFHGICLAELPLERGVFFLAILAQEVLVIFTGYPNPRYHMGFVLALMLALLGNFDFETFLRRNRTAAWLYAVCGVLLLTGPVTTAADQLKMLSGAEGFREYVELTQEEQELDAFLTEENAMLMYCQNSYTGTIFAQYAALCHHPFTLSPSTLSKENVEEFVADFGVDYIQTTQPETIAIFESAFDLEETDHKNVYRLVKNTEEK